MIKELKEGGYYLDQWRPKTRHGCACEARKLIVLTTKIVRKLTENYSAEKWSAWSQQKLQKSKAVVQRFSLSKVLLKISQNSQENTCGRVSFLIKLQAWGFFIEHLWWLLWKIDVFKQPLSHTV